VFYLFNTIHAHQAEYLNSALRRHGVDSVVLTNGLSPEGQPVYSIVCPHAAEAEQARHLLLTDRAFINDLHPECAGEVRILRRENTAVLTRLLSSRRLLILSGCALVIALCGYVFEL